MLERIGHIRTSKTTFPNTTYRAVISKASGFVESESNAYQHLVQQYDIPV